MNVPLDETDRFGIMQVDGDERISAFYEKPKKRDKGTLASMGIYVFNTDVLGQELESGIRTHTDLDFGKHVLPAMLRTRRVFAYAFEGYWVDVGTIQSYWETNLALLAPDSPLNLYDPAWVIHTLSQERPPVKIGLQGVVARSLVSNGCIVRGRVEQSVLSPGVYVSPEAIIRASIVMNDTWIGPGAVLDRVIVDKDVVIGAGTQLGSGDDCTTSNVAQPDILYSGISVVGKGAHIPAGIRIGRNVVVQNNRRESAFEPYGDHVPSGATV